jgi:acetoin utilization deacetylase AcuC-like enzyme
MPTLLLTHPACLDHDTGDYHPESADRLRAVLAALEGEEFAHLLRDEAPQAQDAQLLRAHPREHLDKLRSLVPQSGHHNIDPDTLMSPGTYEAALRSAGAGCAGVDAVMSGQVTNVFCAVRPPGHHAEKDGAMGFCFFNNAAVAALHARDAHGVGKVAVIDFDVHHGNGTQHILWDEPGMFYASTHQEHAYPNTGFPEEKGGQGRMLNVPLPAGSGSDDFRMAYSDIVLPRMYEFRPELIIISAGFDAHAADPMAHLRVTTGDFGWVTRQIMDIAREIAADRVVSLMEGGYDLGALAAAAREHVRALMGY